jgi:hypothetical protein
LEKKADATDLEGMLSKDDLDATAQAIIDQLQDLINRQTASEAQLQNTLAQVGDEMQTKTKNDEFNPFKDDIEKRLRALRKKIEASRKEDLEDLTTPAGAAGFRQQLYNCISCDKNIYMRFNKPILPEPSAFPARISLRPHTAYDINSARKTQNSQEAKIDPLRREGSAYSTKVVEKELERRKKLRENKLRQEINNHSFKGSTIPRQVGGPSYYVDKDLRNYEIANTISRDLESADLEGTDGQLYRGKVVRKLPQLSPKSSRRHDIDHELANRMSHPDEDDHIPPTEVVNE